MNEKSLLRMESQLDSLMTLCQTLDAENKQLRKQQDHLSKQQSDLAEKNQLARTRIENLIAQLRQLEAQCGADH